MGSNENCRGTLMFDVFWVKKVGVVTILCRIIPGCGLLLRRNQVLNFLPDCFASFFFTRFPCATRQIGWEPGHQVQA